MNDYMDENNEPFKIYDKDFKLGLRKKKYQSVPSRLALPRMSLFQNINYSRGSHRRDARYRIIQGRIYNFLERPRGFLAIFYHIMVFFMILVCLALSIFTTIPSYVNEASFSLYRMEVLVVLWLTFEFAVRLWSAGVRSRYQGLLGRLKFMTGTFCIIDLITITASVIALCQGAPRREFAVSTLRVLRFFQILRMLRMDRRGGSWKLLGSVVYAHRQELITSVYIGFLGLTFSAFLVYLVERDVNEQFSNFAKALWWGVITMCTIGYGDSVPITWEGKLIGSIVTLLSYSFFALPAGILGSGFALKVQQQQRQKHMISRFQPAASLIQSAWRYYAADENSTAVATWKIHEIPIHLPSPTSSFKVQSPLRRLPSRRRRSQTIHSPADILHIESAKSGRYLTVFNDKSVESTDEDCTRTPKCNTLLKKHKIAIRFIRMLKFMVARRKFKEALKPYDVKDVLEQYAAGHADLLMRVKNIHARLDLILGGKRAPKIKDAAKICLASRVVKMERQVTGIEDKLDLLIRQYMEDRRRKENEREDTSELTPVLEAVNAESINKREKESISAAVKEAKKANRTSLPSIIYQPHLPANINYPPHRDLKLPPPQQRPDSAIIFIDDLGKVQEEDIFDEEEEFSEGMYASVEEYLGWT
ncbi:PREDICTED: potassium voltage-gated channel subfamily KQT member 4-like [Rhagoletis zephyria]|uniref:potassium voltage-gated channel subfamily KQT member 4-like n=1 Tax=Rhagoletis zephyria TaxID=28612 RepID=UPI0008112F41|nr:PREDICTED: potassium voltage-gated channel subfamily KQT member 4-like [Rhagoletis zephyria]